MHTYHDMRRDGPLGWCMWNLVRIVDSRHEEFYWSTVRILHDKHVTSLYAACGQILYAYKSNFHGLLTAFNVSTVLTASRSRYDDCRI
jgi:hypothetical protein